MGVCELFGYQCCVHDSVKSLPECEEKQLKQARIVDGVHLILQNGNRIRRGLDYFSYPR